ncbi:Zn2-binding protein Melusin/RAR1, contains CHORD domain [Phaffia rhodozyma]|uniref:Zn2-binding protein Melusin/RAR1, contains CHORD domain n=1 Tax=Phaffia rhodozyma TaxID=264483 RepID=A0A0F7SLB0_PHARH|nr:Zn2-binding protein Melusin/RAR1, contains CHORD domain [Phaffia rhodozyma]
MSLTLSCNRPGCGLSFDPENNQPGSCIYHSGAPKFHEGLKSWDCCSDVNKPVMEFDEFVKLKGCTKSTHLAKKADETFQSKARPSEDSTKAGARPTAISSEGVETYGAAAPPSGGSSSTSSAATTIVNPPAAVATAVAASSPSEQVEEQDDPALLPPKSGSSCKRRSCLDTYSSDDQDGGECWYHPGIPIFREGSKGFTCCKRRTLEFDEFLKIKGCRLAKAHLWVGAKPKEADLSAERELVNARVDHYQTPSQVHVSVFAKSVDKELSKITIESEAIHLDLILPLHKRTVKTIRLFGPIDVEKSRFDILGTKVGPMSRSTSKEKAPFGWT